MVAGEDSGDQLGAALISELGRLCPDLHCAGIGGPRMRKAGFEAWWDIAELSVMGLFEVIRHLPRLLRLRKALVRRILDERPDVLIGIDAPDFNLGLEKKVRAAGVRTVHYVSPTVWAWRQGRARKIGDSAELVLCLFPFEPAFYAGHGVTARYTGHPLADSVPLYNDHLAARQALGLRNDAPTVALLPGSRASEVARLAGPMLDAAALLASRHPDLQFIAPMASARVRKMFEQALAARQDVAVTLSEDASLQAMAAADVVVCASGTATLECLLVNRPMVVVYRLSGMTYATGKALKLVKTEHFSLPNLLAGERLVPELIQHEVTGEQIAQEVENWLQHPERAQGVRDRFDALHGELKTDAAATAAGAIRDLLEGPGDDA